MKEGMVEALSIAALCVAIASMATCTAYEQHEAETTKRLLIEQGLCGDHNEWKPCQFKKGE